MKRFLLFPLIVCIFLIQGCIPPTEGLRHIPGFPALQDSEYERPVYPLPTKPEATDPFRTELPVEDIILYFNEVCLDAEYSSSGNPNVIQKWTQPIRYSILGDPTETDLQVLEGFALWLNQVEGFPGIYPADDSEAANLRIHFCDQDTLISTLGSNFSYADGGVTFWYTSANSIYDATICCRTDLSQHLRNSVILEELYNGLGPAQDTELRKDSLISADYSEPQALTAVDELILRLLYHPDMKCGMNAAECEEVIRRLCG